MSIRVSTHAVERYIERIDPEASWGAVIEILTEALSTASREKRKTFAGDTIFAASSFRMVVAEENGHREVLTVLPIHGSREEHIPEMAAQLAAEFREWEAGGGASGTSELRKLRDGYRRQQALIAALQSKLSEKQLPKQVNHELKSSQERIAKLEKLLTKQTVHGQHMFEEREAVKNTLKSVLTHILRGDTEGALAVVEAQAPGLVEYLKKGVA